MYGAFLFMAISMRASDDIGPRLAPTVEGLGYELWGIERLKCPRSDIPAVTHVDYSARIQTVCSETNPDFYDLISEFEKVTNCPVLVNTSFNVRGEPIVNSPGDAYTCFMRTNLDILVIGPFILFKEDQEGLVETEDWRWKFQLD